MINELSFFLTIYSQAKDVVSVCSRDQVIPLKCMGASLPSQILILVAWTIFKGQLSNNKQELLETINQASLRS